MKFDRASVVSPSAVLTAASGCFEVGVEKGRDLARLTATENLGITTVGEVVGVLEGAALALIADSSKLAFGIRQICLCGLMTQGFAATLTAIVEIKLDALASRPYAARPSTPLSPEG